MDIIASQTLGRGDQEAIHLGSPDGITEAIEPRPIQSGATIAIITENPFGLALLPLRLNVSS
jgi:hypothetical protein